MATVYIKISGLTPDHKKYIIDNFNTDNSAYVECGLVKCGNTGIHCESPSCLLNKEYQAIRMEMRNSNGSIIKQKEVI